MSSFFIAEGMAVNVISECFYRKSILLKLDSRFKHAGMTSSGVLAAAK